MRTRKLGLLLAQALLLCLAIVPTWVIADEDQSSSAPSQDELFQRFEKLLSGAQLIGYFTTHGEEESKPLHADKYTIDKVSKGKGDFWLFDARIQYNNQDQKMRMPLEVKWAGDTPVITLTKVLVPGLGTFSARILFYGDEYAGTWSAGDHGGHMFGRVEKIATDQPKSDTTHEGDTPRKR